jgi:DNA-binding transcriptional LysR family regulator
MAEFVETKLQSAAVVLATERNYAAAAEKLNISRSELELQVGTLETLLCLKVFRMNGRDVMVTDEGRLFVERCEAFLTERDTNNL